MKIATGQDTTGYATYDYRWFAYDDDTFDGAPDARSPIGHGATEQEAINDLLEQMKP